MNRQGNDIGSSYRSTIFYQDKSQQEAAEAAITRNQPYWEQPIITSIEPLTTFWLAEQHHQDYLQNNIGGYTCHFERAR